MLLLHMQEIVFVDSQEGLLSSRGGGGGGGADILAPGLQTYLLPLDTIQCNIRIRPMYNLLHLRILLCVYMCT